MKPSVAVLGAGTLGGIVIEALLDAGWPAASVCALEQREERARELTERHGITVSTSLERIVTDRQVLVVAVKPQDVAALLDSIRDRITDDHVVLSVAAGVPLAGIESVLGSGVPVVRAMPNTPAAVGAGMTAYARGTSAGDVEVARCHEILSTFGEAIEVPEPSLDAVTAVSGSGPAYVFLLAEAMEEAALSLGLSPDVARLLVTQTIDGAGSLLKAVDQDAAALRAAVTSPGGTTAAALDVFAEGGFVELVRSALEAAAARSAELGAG